jgi:hypothetical protein
MYFSAVGEEGVRPVVAQKDGHRVVIDLAEELAGGRAVISCPLHVHLHAVP